MKAMKFLFFAITLLFTINLYAGDISIHNSIIRLVPDASTVSASFMKIKNSGKKDIRLIKVECGISKSVELHSMIMEGDQMIMRPTDHMLIKAMSELDLKRGSFHIMFIDLLKPLKEGEKKSMKFIFDNGEQLSMDVPVARID